MRYDRSKVGAGVAMCEEWVGRWRCRGCRTTDPRDAWVEVLFESNFCHSTTDSDGYKLKPA